MKTTRRSFIRNVSATGVVSIGASAPAFLNRAAYAGEKSKSRDRQKILVLEIDTACLSAPAWKNS